MLARISSGSVVGLNGMAVDVEVDVAGRGFPTFTIVGLANKAIDEAKERVRTAVGHAGFEMPDSRITVNLAPADIPKTGSAFDLPIAVGILAASNAVSLSELSSALVAGELSLEGKVRPVPGVLSLAMLAAEKGYKTLYIPQDNAFEAAFIEGVTVYGVQSLADLVLHLNGQRKLEPQLPADMSVPESVAESVDFREVKGQQQAKRAMEIAAAGFHNIHLKGPPGAGKTMLSRMFSSILPPLDRQQILEVSRIYSVAGLLDKGKLIYYPPFRAPHHTTSRVGLVGGGSHPSPGEITLAHRGVLFLDELPEFPRSVIESLRQPLEDGIVTVSRAAGSISYPARFLMLCASNPCPCGYRGHPSKVCSCSPLSVDRYKKRLSGPLMDRIDIHLDVAPVTEAQLSDTVLSESSENIRKRIASARERQRNRLRQVHKAVNGEMTSADVRRTCVLDDGARQLLSQAMKTLSLSARAYFKLIKISQTIADLSESDRITTEYVSEALQYRVKD